MMKISLLKAPFSLVILAVTALVIPLRGADAPFKATLTTDRSSVVSGGSVYVTISLNHNDLEGDIRLPEVNGGAWRTDQVSQGSSTSVVNGVWQRSVTYSLPLTVSAPPGSTVKIPAISFKRKNGSKAATAAVDIRVLKEGEVPPGEKITAEILFPDGSKKYYAGEDVPLELRLSVPFRMRIRSAGYPVITGLEKGITADYSKVNPRNPRFAPPSERREGNKVIISFNTAVRFPVPGTYRPAAAMEIAVERPSARRGRSPFDDDFFGDSFFGGAFSRNPVETRRLTFAPPPGDIVVIPLPPPPAGARVLETVGDWQISAALGSNSVRCGEPVELTVTLTGSGNAAGLTAPKLSIPGFRIYPPELKTAPGKVTVSYALIPLESGEKSLDLSFAVFNTAAGKYLLSSSPLKLAVTGALPTAASAPPAAAAPEPENKSSELQERSVPAPRQELFYQKAAPRGKLKVPLWRNTLPAASVITGAALIAAVIIEWLERRREERMNDPEFAAHRLRRRQLPELLAVLRQGRADEDFIRLKILPFIVEALHLPPGSDAADAADKISDPEAAELLRQMSRDAFIPRSGEESKKPIPADAAKSFIRLLRKLTLAVAAVAAFTLCGAGFEAGNAAFNVRDYRKAVEEYRKAAWQNDGVSPFALYNLGNSYYMMGDYPMARAALETAHRLMPGDSECTANLDLVNRKLLLPEAEPAATPREVLSYCRNRLRPDHYLLIAAVLLSAAMVVTALRRRFNGTVFAAAVISLLTLSAAAGAIMVYQQNTLYSPERAIVTAPRIELRSRPTLSSGRVEAVIPGGSDARIIESRGGWYRIELNGQDGWVQQKELHLCFVPPELPEEAKQ